MLPSSCRYASAVAVTLLALNAVRADEPVRLTVQPAKIELQGRDARHHVLVTATSADGRTVDVTASATYSSAKPNVVAVSPLGECRALTDGDTSMQIRYAGQTCAVPVTVKDSASTAPPSFVNEVMPLFTRLGCNQGACHGKAAGQNGFRLSLRGYAPEMDHEYLTRELDGRRLC